MNESSELIKEFSKGINIKQSIYIVLSIFIIQTIIGLILSVIDSTILNLCGIYNSIYTDTIPYVQTLTQIITYMFVIKRNVYEKNYHLKLEYKLDFRVYLFVVLVIVGYSLIYHNTLLILLINFFKNSSSIKAIQEIMTIPVLGIIGVIFIGPIFEEVIFRGILLEQLSIRYKPIVSIIISSLLFAILHLNIIQGVNVFIMGILSGIIYLKTYSLIPCILLHFINNLMPFIAKIFPMGFVDGFSIIQLIIGTVISIVSIFIFKNIATTQQFPR